MTLKLSNIKPHDKVKLKENEVHKLKFKIYLALYAKSVNLKSLEFEVLDIREFNDEKIVTLILEKLEDGEYAVLPILESELEYIELV